VKLRNLAARAPLAPAHRRLQEAAVEYVMHGWGVVPGSACDGLAYTKGHTRERMPTFGSAHPSGRTVRSPKTASSWWALAPYGIGARAGEDFDVIECPTWLAVLATGRPEFRGHLCPVSLSPAGVRVLVACGARLRGELASVRGVRVAESGRLVPMPPTRILGGLVTWWTTPSQVNWRIGDPDVVQAAILAVLGESTQAGDARA
jgi:hypothetical protein